MPRDNAGNFSLTAGYLAVLGEDAEPTQHNAPLEDLAAAMSASLPISGAKAMTGPIKLSSSGTASAPSLAFSNDLTSGVFPRSGGGLGLTDGGVPVGAVPIGGGMDFWGTTAPTGWLFPYGQAVSRTTYAALFAALGTTYGTGDGSTTFNLPDKRDRASFGKSNMGGTSANRITNKTGGWNGDTLGDSGGEETHGLLISEMPLHNHGGSTGDENPRALVTQGLRNVQNPTDNSTNDVTAWGAGTSTLSNVLHSHTIPDQGGGLAHNTLPPGIVCNYIIFAGA